MPLDTSICGVIFFLFFCTMIRKKIGEIEREKEELLEKKRRLLIQARIAVEWGKEDLLSKFEKEIKAVNYELNSLKCKIKNGRE